MKRAILILLALCAVQTATPAHAEEAGVNLLLTGGPEADVIEVKVSPDGRSYLIDAQGPLEVGGAICIHPEGRENALLCEAKAISSFEVNAGGGDDSVNISPKVTVPVTLRGGPGNDRLRGGGGSDKLVGGSGDDTLIGEGGDDWLYGGPGNDHLYGGPGNDRLIGGPGNDVLNGGPGNDVLVGGPGHNVLDGGPGENRLTPPIHP